MSVATNRDASTPGSSSNRVPMGATLRDSGSQRFDVSALADAEAFAHVVGSSQAIRDAIDLARQVAESPLTTVLLEGETGTGKELFARGIHRASNSTEHFVAINCAAIPGNLLESELFGHEKGAFTGATESKPGLLEHAHTGTLFLDEVNQLPLDLQSKLLRVLEDRTYRRVGGAHELSLRCRIIAGTNTPLEIAVAAGRFRGDLFFRLNVFRIELPPLRTRPADIVPIAERFLCEIASRRGTVPKTIDENSKALLQKHSWPGNAREVRNVMERASILAAGSVIQPSHLKLQHRELVSFGDADSIAGMIAIPTRGKSLEEVEREAVRLTMILTAGNLSAASRILGISRPTLARKMRDAGITRRSLLASS
jgi:two-component system NtrC family response regulator